MANMTSDEKLRYTIACLRRKAELEGERGNVLVSPTVLLELLDRIAELERELDERANSADG